MENDLEDLKSKYTQLSDKLSNLNKDSVLINDSSSSSKFASVDRSSFNTLNVIKEYNLRQKKMNNIIIYKFQEGVKDNKYDETNDVTSVTNLLSCFAIDTRLNLNNISRIGRFELGNSRPVLVKSLTPDPMPLK